MFIQCSQCAKRMSDRAPRCPFCGAEAEGSAAPRRIERQQPVPGTTKTAICDHAAVAAEAVEYFAREQVKLDYSLASLGALDQHLVDAFGEAGRAAGAEKWSPAPADRRLIALVGSYLGEVLRQRVGGGWSDDPERPKMPLFVRLELPNHVTILPLERAYRRLKDGLGQGLSAFAEDLRLAVGDLEPRAEDGMDWANQASDYIRSERYDVALRLLEQAVRIDPKLCEGWFCRGFVEERLRRPDDALRSYEHAQRLSPPDDPSFLQHVKAQIQRLHAELGGFKTATGEFRAVRGPAHDERSAAPPVAPAPLAHSDASSSESGLQDLRAAASSGAPNIASKIQDNRAADADTAAPGSNVQAAIDDAAAAVRHRMANPDSDAASRDEPAALSLDERPTAPETKRQGLAFAETMQGEEGLSLQLGDAAPPSASDPFRDRPGRQTLPASAFEPQSVQDAARARILDTETPPSGIGLASLDEAMSLAGAGRLDEAASYALAALEVARDAQAWLDIARILAVADRPNEALRAIRRALDDDPGDPEAYRLQGRLLMAQDLTEDALGAATAALARWPSAAWAWLLHGRAHFAADRFDEAVGSLERCLGIDPSSEEAWRLRGYAELECGRLEEARCALRAYLALSDLSGGAVVNDARRQLAKLELAR
jgi:tetratricopeptide (TPR) repeat protein